MKFVPMATMVTQLEYLERFNFASCVIVTETLTPMLLVTVTELPANA